jgi:hypothetical protein
LGFAGKKDRRKPLDNPPRDSTADFIDFMADGRLAGLGPLKFGLIIFPLTGPDLPGGQSPRLRPFGSRHFFWQYPFGAILLMSCLAAGRPAR